MRIAIFGGTFDPIHNAHLGVAGEALDRARLDCVLFVPAAIPPHKARILGAGYEDRYRMVELACAADPRFIPSRIEAGETKSYSIHTIERVNARLGPADVLYFLIGADAFADITTWYRWNDLIAIVRFLVMTRPGHGYASPPGAAVESLETLMLETSSTAIREALSQGSRPPDLPPAVYEYIKTHRLYRA